MRFGVAVALAFLGHVGTALAQGDAAKPPVDPNATCLLCHKDPAAKSASGKSIGVDAAQFKASVHGSLRIKCTDCHADASPEKIPHAEKLKPVDCAACHEDAVKDYAATAHGKARAAGKQVAATCADCHGAHDIRRSKDAASRTHPTKVESTCGACHGNEAMIKEARLPGGNVAAKYHDSIHGKLTAAKDGGTRGAPTCTGCHGTHNILPKSDLESRVSRAKMPDTCGSCHQRIRMTFDSGQHGKLRQKGITAGPGCIDCHSAHAIQRHDLPKWQVEVIAQCGTCHEDFIKTYRDTFHGQVTRLGYTRVATCAACHDAHDVRPASDPASSIAPGNRVATCQKCHAGANANFAAFDPHANRHDRERNPYLYYAGLFMDLLLLGVFVFFGIHTVFWFVRSLRVVRERRRNRGAGGGDR
jgi:nitrate/TMAO reductase-like tetraheme cytochrome c subunit